LNEIDKILVSLQCPCCQRWWTAAEARSHTWLAVRRYSRGPHQLMTAWSMHQHRWSETTNC